MTGGGGIACLLRRAERLLSSVGGTTHPLGLISELLSTFVNASWIGLLNARSCWIFRSYGRCEECVLLVGGDHAFTENEVGDDHAFTDRGGTFRSAEPVLIFAYFRLFSSNFAEYALAEGELRSRS